MNNSKDSFSNLQLTFLLLLRFSVGWHILYEGLAKALSPQWSSLVFLQQTRGLFTGMSDWIVSNPVVLNLVDFLNTWGLISIGLGVVLGLFFRGAVISGATILLFYFLCNPPLIGSGYSSPVDGNNLLIDETLIEALSLCVLALFPTNRIFGLDAFTSKLKTLKNTK
ncbi:DoxX subfamily [Mangrovibacterium diazotrophicum]|uniref:Thiosulfate dehydrogenase [quinone] large subunit n=1 Tax=Mangrovibacterium diazotrophicum TaxID=1261403 RepID=A0A419VW46_9BACT|nr:DoxX subfamily [Mangrovibacterium diazotrophicum]RKD86380.1 thiosulfate dehydrogenase [quinone] large subunit [Mangrovibacterium diazotrophicum]